jgi:hypothetical protein
LYGIAWERKEKGKTARKRTKENGTRNWGNV